MLKKEISIQICKLDNALNANEASPWMLIRKCLLAMLILMLVILMLILMLLNLNTGYADTDVDLCIRIMSLCCISNRVYNTAGKSTRQQIPSVSLRVELQGGYLRVFEGDVSIWYQPLLPLIQPLPPVLWHAAIQQQCIMFLERQLSSLPSLEVVQRCSLNSLRFCQKKTRLYRTTMDSKGKLLKFNIILHTTIDKIILLLHKNLKSIRNSCVYLIYVLMETTSLLLKHYFRDNFVN